MKNFATLLNSLFKNGLTALIFGSFLVTHRARAERIFFVTGEPSGDELARWFIQQNNLNKESNSLYGSCGLELAKIGITQTTQLKASSIPTKLALFCGFQPHSFTRLKQAILACATQHLVLVDFPFVNLLLAKEIKKANPAIKITYIAPPELWFWGEWGRAKVLQEYCDNIIVLYPHEVVWYKKIGLQVTWLGYPFAKELGIEKSEEPPLKKPLIALLPGSRKDELALMLPILCQAAQLLHTQHPELQFVIPYANEEMRSILTHEVNQRGLSTFVSLCAHDDYPLLRTCCLAITKPGTNTLQLALLQIPLIVTFRVPWVLYLYIKIFVRPTFVSLPNLLADRALVEELLQTDCCVEKITSAAEQLYQGYKANTSSYQATLTGLRELKKVILNDR